MIDEELVLRVEAALLSAGRPVAIDELATMFEDWKDPPDRRAIRDAIAALAEQWRGHSLEVGEVASGYRAQIRKEYSRPLSILWQERPARYSRALLETLALIAYRQPISRGEIEEIRGVGVSSSIMKTLVEREWVRVVGHREAPGRPALYGTTKPFLDTFGLKSLEALPPLAELRDLEDPRPDLFAGLEDAPATGEEPEPSGVSVALEVQAEDGPEPAAEANERSEPASEDASPTAPESMALEVQAEDGPEPAVEANERSEPASEGISPAAPEDTAFAVDESVDGVALAPDNGAGERAG